MRFWCAGRGGGQPPGCLVIADFSQVNLCLIPGLITNLVSPLELYHEVMYLGIPNAELKLE